MFGFDIHQGTSGFTWSLKKIGQTKGGFNTKIHMICADENNPVIFSLSPGNVGDALCGRKKLGKQKNPKYLLWTKHTKAMKLDF